MRCQYKNGKEALSFWTNNASSSQKNKTNASDCLKTEGAKYPFCRQEGECTCNEQRNANLVEQVRSVERCFKEHTVFLKAKNLFDVINDLCRSCGCKTQYRNPWELTFQNPKDFVIRSKVMAPLTCAMNFIYYNS